ncbi:unnamed protein product [Gordionus sp. m RMFG-2023]|uniref:proteasomal ubiquitin receptor ADRM1-B-like n=1 Tax=Gordionus sp. m RMFG-2023 TaxID=3053472 RepID=UPI0030DE9E34
MASIKIENLIEMKAGKMYLKGDTIFPDKRKGLLYLYRSDDALVHFCWKDRTTGLVEDDLILFPDDVEVKKIESCKDGRIYLLKFKSAQNKQFYWMQESKVEKDEENWKKIIDIVNGDNESENMDHESTMNNFNSDLSSINLGNMNDSDLQTLLGSLNRNQLVQLLSNNLGNLSSILGMNSNASQSSLSKINKRLGEQSGTKAAAYIQDSASTDTKSNKLYSQAQKPNDKKMHKKIELSLLQNVLSNLDKSTNPPIEAEQNKIVDKCSDFFKLDLINNVCTSHSNVKDLMTYLPQRPSNYDISDQEYVKENLLCPQFKQAFRVFYQAFLSGQLTSLIQGFGFKGKVVDACTNGDWAQFIQALDEHHQNLKKDNHSLD